MHHWAVGGDINIGWPDHGAEERPYTIVEMDLFGKVFRGRVTNGQRQGGFMVIFDCPNVILEQLAEQASNVVGFRVIVSNLRTRANRQLLTPDDRGYQVQGRQKIQAPAIIPGGDSAPLLQFVEGSLNQVALPIQFPVVFPRVPPV